MTTNNVLTFQMDLKDEEGLKTELKKNQTQYRKPKCNKTRKRTKFKEKQVPSILNEKKIVK